jgi:poly-gamma-glutamate synthesis protein (capsule biosynthesis protein)
MKKIFPALVFAFTTTTLGVVSIFPDTLTYTQSSEIEKVPEKKVDVPITMIFFGDGMFDRGVKNSVRKNFNDDFNQLFVNLPEIKTYDIAFMNLEGPISLNGRNVGSKYSFRFEPRVAQALSSAGFDIVSSANNHMGDWTVTAFKDTLTHLTENNIKFTGGGMTKIDAESPTIISVHGKNIGFLGFTDVGPAWLEAKESAPGILLASDPRFSEIISTAKSQVDFLIVSFHWGDEYVVHSTRQTTLAHTAIDNGADAIIGHHPHVEQATEWYKEKFIAYSLGNFVFDQYFSPETMKGLAIELSLSQDTNLYTVKKFDVSLSKYYQPQSLVERI